MLPLSTGHEALAASVALAGVDLALTLAVVAGVATLHALYLTLRPLAERAKISTEEWERMEDEAAALMIRRDRLIDELKDIEFEAQMNKLGDGDLSALRGRYEAEALAVISELDARAKVYEGEISAAVEANLAEREARRAARRADAAPLLLLAALLGGALGAGAARAEAPFLNAGGLPPFLASMQKHELMVSVQVAGAGGAVAPAPAGLPVGVRILAQGQKVRDYNEQTDAQGRAFFLGVPSNPEVQMSITYEVWVDYEGVRFPFNLDGVPRTVDKEALLDEFDPSARLPENRITLTVRPPSRGLAGVSVHHSLIELHPDEESLLVIHEMVLKNDSDALLDLSHQPQGGLRLPAPDGAKSPELHQGAHEDLEVRGAALYYIGALLPKSSKTIKWYYTLPYRAERFAWSQAMPVPATVGIVVAPRYKKEQHQRQIPLSLTATAGAGGQPLGEMRPVSTGPGLDFHSLRVSRVLEPGEPLVFEVGGLPAPPRWRRLALLGAALLAVLLAVAFALLEGSTAGQLSRAQMVIERDRLLKALARMEVALKREQITPQRYSREREVITARLVTLYRALERVEQG